ncbi:MAG: hypothetical protein RJB08_1743 [Actinomycetota bacterium]
MNDNFDSALDNDSNLKNPSRAIRANDHREVVVSKDPNRVSQGVAHVLIDNSVLSRGVENGQVVVIKIY